MSFFIHPLRLFVLGVLLCAVSSFLSGNLKGTSVSSRRSPILMKQRHPQLKTKGQIEIILKRDFETLGKKDDKVSVRGGYFMNYLLPRDIAFRASDLETKPTKAVNTKTPHKVVNKV
jgi:hypothetical protein